MDYPHLWQFVTFRLADALPRATVDRWKRELGSRLSAERERLLSRRIDVFEDAGSGACVLRQDRCAEIVAQAMWAGNGSAYRIAAWVIMPNHVHVVIGPMGGDSRIELSAVTRVWKGASARRINLLLGRTGALWQRESFDRWIRDEQHFQAVAGYIAKNPVKAGLCARVEDWRWSHAWVGVHDDQAG